jgi:xanthine dehydrogenase D subunit
MTVADTGTGLEVTGAPRGVLGESVLRPDALTKTQGRFSFANDLHHDDMLWGATLRSPHPHARIAGLDVSAAWRIPGVECVITADDVPGLPAYGLITADQPVFARDVVRYHGEPICAVAATDADTARRAIEAVVVHYEVLDPLVDPEQAIAEGAVFAHQRIVHGDQELQGDIQVEGTYELGMQDQAFLGTEAALAVPDHDGAGVELHVATQWLHEDRRQIAACLGMPEEQVRIVLGGVGGAFGAREDISLQVHTCLLALRTGRPVKLQYGREESFYGHVHRHPARIWMRHHATTEGKLLRVEARFVFDGGAYTSTSPAVLLNGITQAQGPYACENGTVDGWAVQTNNPPCGAMRGFGVVQACFAHESQMDKLAAACGLDPVELRLRNAMRTGDTFITGQVLRNVAPVERLLRECAALPLPDEPVGGHDADPLRLPGGAGMTADIGRVRRGVGYAASVKNLMYSDGFDDYATARCVLAGGVAALKFATVEVGQGFVTIAGQIARSLLGVDTVELERIDTGIGSAGSTSASRQTWMSGGAVHLACTQVRDQFLAAVAVDVGVPADRLVIDGDHVVETGGSFRAPVSALTLGRRFEATAEYHHPPTVPLDENGQGDVHVAFAFAVHRAVVDVDIDLGLVRVVQVATAQDVGVALNPLSVIGQLEGGIAQGLGLAVMEEIVVDNGVVRNASFTDYLLPTALDAPEIAIALVEEPDPFSPLGAKGVGEPPTVSSTPAIVAAIRDATGVDLVRVPVRPYDIALAEP